MRGWTSGRRGRIGHALAFLCFEPPTCDLCLPTCDLPCILYLPCMPVYLPPSLAMPLQGWMMLPCIAFLYCLFAFLHVPFCPTFVVDYLIPWPPLCAVLPCATPTFLPAFLVPYVVFIALPPCACTCHALFVPLACLPAVPCLALPAFGLADLPAFALCLCCACQLCPLCLPHTPHALPCLGWIYVCCCALACLCTMPCPGPPSPFPALPLDGALCPGLCIVPVPVRLPFGTCLCLWDLALPAMHAFLPMGQHAFFFLHSFSCLPCHLYLILLTLFFPPSPFPCHVFLCAFFPFVLAPTPPSPAFFALALPAQPLPLP